MKTIADHILDIFQNSVRAKATDITIRLSCSDAQDRVELSIEDNGCGMDEAMVNRVSDPFFTSRTHRKVGLGIPLLIQNAQMSGGDVKICSEVGKGTTLRAWFVKSHWDRPPLGNLPELMSLMITGNPELNVRFEVLSNEMSYVIDTMSIKEVLQGVPINTSDVVLFLKEMFSEEPCCCSIKNE